MTNIAAVIGWKFDHQEGMETADGEITLFPGGIPSQSDQDAWTDEYNAYKAVMDEIERLETIPRRIRENLIALGTEDQVVIDEDAAIAVEREKL
jgi:hypothetical protein